MQVHARLRSQRGTPAGEVRARTLRALAVMGLWRVRNTQVRPLHALFTYLLGQLHMGKQQTCMQLCMLHASAVTDQNVTIFPTRTSRCTLVKAGTCCGQFSIRTASSPLHGFSLQALCLVELVPARRWAACCRAASACVACRAASSAG